MNLIRHLYTTLFHIYFFPSFPPSVEVWWRGCARGRSQFAVEASGGGDWSPGCARWNQQDCGQCHCSPSQPERVRFLSLDQLRRLCAGEGRAVGGNTWVPCTALQVDLRFRTNLGQSARRLCHNPPFHPHYYHN